MMKHLITFLVIISSLFLVLDNVNAATLNGYSVDDSVIQACDDLDYNYHFIFQEKGYYNYYVFSCSYYPATFYNNGSTWGKGFYYHTIYDDNGNFQVINASGDTNKSNSFKAYKNGSISSAVTRHTGLHSGTVVYYSNHKIYNYVYGTSDTSTLYYDCNGDSCVSNTDILDTNLDVSVDENNSYKTTFNDKNFMLTIENDFCANANDENYIDYKIKLHAKNSFNEDWFGGLYLQSLYVNNAKFGLYVDDAINSMSAEYDTNLIDESNAEILLRLKIEDYDFACTTLNTPRMFKFDLGQLIYELNVNEFDIEIQSSAINNNYMILPQKFYDYNTYYINKDLYNSSVIYYLEPLNVTESTDATIYLRNKADYGVWNYQNNTSRREKYFDLTSQYGFQTYKIEFDTENSKITGFKSYENNLVFLDTAYSLKVHHPQEDFIIGDVTIKDNTDEVEIIKDSYSNTGDLLDTFTNFLDKIKNIIAPIMDLFGYLFNSMNEYIKGAIISLLIIVIICVIIKQLYKS